MTACAWLLQSVPCRNVRRLHLSFLVGDLGCLSDLHRERLPSDRGSLQGGTPGVCGRGDIPTTGTDLFLFVSEAHWI